MSRVPNGFTLIELLVVIVVIGVLAAIAVPKFGSTRTAAYYSTLRTDLNNLRSAQEIYFQTSGGFSYAPTTDNLELALSSGVTISDIGILNGGAAWEAVATHAGLADGACVIGFGEVGSDSWSASGGDPAVSVTAQNAGAPVCND